MTEPLRTLIVDDEPLAVERLQLLAARIPDVTVIGTAADGASALKLVEQLAPDLLLLDISMPGLDGMDVARAIAPQTRPPAIIFTTAYDQFAVAAFDISAVDYLLKPVAGDRLERAIKRVLERTGENRPHPGVAQSDWMEELWVPRGAEIVRISASDIERIEAERDYMRLHLAGRSYLIHQTITELEQRLDPAVFIRLHRSAIVRRDMVVKLHHDGCGAWTAELADGTRLRIGRTYLSAAKKLAGR